LSLIRSSSIRPRIWSDSTPRMPPPSMASNLRGPFLARRFVRSTRRSESRPGMFCLPVIGPCQGPAREPVCVDLYRKLGGSHRAYPWAPLGCRKEQYHRASGVSVGAVTSACIPQTELLYFASAGHHVSPEPLTTAPRQSHDPPPAI